MHESDVLPSNSAAAYYGEDGELRVPKDGRLLARISMGLSIGGIVVPILLSTAAIIVAGWAKHRLGKAPSVKHSRSLANIAQAIAVLDFVGISLWALYVWTMYD